jgi:hypothetical protein
MPYCPRCGVEADPSVRECPLCFTAIPRLEDLGPGTPAWPDPAALSPAANPSKRFATVSELRGRAFLTLAGVLAVAAVAVLATDLFVHQGVTWSRYPLAALTTAFLLLAAAFAWHRRPVFWGAAWMVTVVGFLGALDGFDDGRWGWFPGLGLPLTVISVALTGLGVVVVRRSRHRGYNLFGLVPALVAAELGAIDGLVTAWATGRVGFGWSLVAALALVPLALLFFVLHYGFRRRPDLGRTFHF